MLYSSVSKVTYPSKVYPHCTNHSWKDINLAYIKHLHFMYMYSKMSSSANTSRRRGILSLLLRISKMVWHEHINKSISFHMQIRFLNSRLPF